MAFMNENPRARAAVIGVVVVGALVGILAFWYYSGRESTDNAQVDGHITPLAARVGGTVLAVNIHENQLVEAGAVLVTIDSRDYEVALARAQADLADATAALDAARSGVPITMTTTSSQLTTARTAVERSQTGIDIAGKDIESARARRASAQARVREARANQARAAKDLERMKPLVAKDEISQQQFDLAATAAEAAAANTEAAMAALADAEQAVLAAEGRRAQALQQTQQVQADLRTAQTAPEQVTVIKARAASAEARVAQATAALHQAEFNLQYTQVKAPVRGYVSKKSVEPGQVIQAGQPLCAVVALDDIWIMANFKETQLNDVRPGQRAIIHVDMYGQDFPAKVDSLSAATGARFSLLPPENATGNFVKVVQRIPVKILLDQPPTPDRVLRPGMSVTATILTR
ncbi:MAG: HlyD family secretion protein [Acidobacteria bacterium]|nr:HlyD family secretion protein [Acidobacteriota bacterium]